jgi:hypothetical protein
VSASPAVRRCAGLPRRRWARARAYAASSPLALQLAAVVQLTVLDALAARGVTRLDRPAPPAEVWAALRAAQDGAGT